MKNLKAYVDIWFVKVKRKLFGCKHIFIVTKWFIKKDPDGMTAQILCCSKCFKVDRSFEDV